MLLLIKSFCARNQMKKKIFFCFAVVLMTLLLSTILFGCEKTGNSHMGDPTEEDEEEQKIDYKMVRLSDVYFPDGLLDTGFGMFIWDKTNKTWVRTNSAEGKALFDKTKSISVFAHGKGGNGYSSKPDLYNELGYNVINFAWGAFSNEDLKFLNMTDKIWFGKNMRWLSNDGEFIEDDVPNVSVTEMYVAYYYDLLSAFPDYSGKEIVLMGHSFGCSQTMASVSCLYSAYERGELPAYMLPDKIHLLDPYFARATERFAICPWLKDEEQISTEKTYKERGNILKAVYNTSIKCKKYGTAIGLFRASKYVCYQCTQNEFGEDLTGAYWNFCNNIVYSHVADSVRYDLHDYTPYIHQYGWDWFTDFYHEGQELKDAASSTNEEAYFMGMSYDAMFARMGTKYELDINGTDDNNDDDILTSFMCDYNTEVNDSIKMAIINEDDSYHSEVKSKIAGFAYVDANGNGEFDDRICNLVAGMQVRIVDKDGNEIYSAVTGENGYYEKEVDAPGSYTLYFTAPDGRAQSSGSYIVDITDSNRQLCIYNVRIGK